MILEIEADDVLFLIQTLAIAEYRTCKPQLTLNQALSRAHESVELYFSRDIEFVIDFSGEGHEHRHPDSG